MSDWHIGVLWDSGLEAPEVLEDAQEFAVASAFGEPSGPVAMGRIGGVRLTLLARHGTRHRLPAPEVNHRANIDVLKRCGVTDVLAIAGAAPLRDGLAPGDFVAVEQVIDRTTARDRSFFGAGFAACVDLTDPTCPRLTGHAAESAEAAKARVHRGACCIAVEGLRGLTHAESELYRDWGGDVAGTAVMPEATLAREAELPYAVLAEIPGTRRGAPFARILKALAGVLPERREASPIDRALDGALVTAPEDWDRIGAARLDAVAGRVLRERRPDWF